jgi:hypothetical protein
VITEADEAYWRELTRQISYHKAEMTRLAMQRTILARRLNADPDENYVTMGKRFGVSVQTINKIIHRGEPKAGTRKKPAG